MVRGQALRSMGWLLAAGCLLLGVLAPLTGASAHASLASSAPGDGDVVQDLPPAVQLTFGEAIATPAYVVVRDPAGHEVAEGEPDVVDAVVTQPVVGREAAGEYTVDYRVVSADGHPVSGTLTFAVRSGDRVTEATADGPSEVGGFWERHWEHVALAGVGLIAGVALLGTGLRGRS